MQKLTRDNDQNETETRSETFSNFVKFLRQDARVLTVGAVLGAAIGFGSSYLVHRQWQATQVVQIGQVYNGNAAVLLETPPNLLTRVQLRSFQLEVLKQLGWPAPPTNDPRTQLLMASLRAKVLSTDLLEVDVNGRSEEDARSELEATLKTLYGRHESMITPSVTRMNTDLSETTQRLAQAEERGQRLGALAQDRLKSRGSDSANSSTDIMVAELIDANDRTINTLREHRDDMKERLDPQRTFVTRPVGGLSTGDGPVYPRRMVMAFAGLVVGIGLALSRSLFVSMRSTRSRRDV
jgi:hypothetical protein